MPWFRLDDSFHSHPKVIAAGNEAVGLYVRCGTYAAEHLTDGFVGRSIVLLYGSSALAVRLVEAKLWHRTRGGWNIHDYLDYNPSREQVEKERKAAAERQRQKRARDLAETSTGHSRDTAETQTGYGTAASGNPVDNQVRQENGRQQDVPSHRDSQRDTAVSHTTPTRPDPHISGTGLSSATGRARGRPDSKTITEALARPDDRQRPASPDAVHAAAEQARQAMAAKLRPP